MRERLPSSALDIKKQELVDMRIIKNGSGYELVELDRKLKNRLLRNLRQRNKTLMKKCIEDAEKLCAVPAFEASPYAVMTIATALFDKLASKSFTELCAAETRVTHELKETWKMQKQAANREYYEELCKDAERNVFQECD